MHPPVAVPKGASSAAPPPPDADDVRDGLVVQHPGALGADAARGLSGGSE